MTDALDERTGGLLGERCDGAVARLTITGLHAHLDELVIAQRAHRLGCDRRGEPVLSDLDDRLERVRAASQKTQLFFA